MTALAMRQDHAAPSLPSVGDRLVYAIGDVHGRLDLLQALVTDIVADAVASQPKLRPLIILLGDYIDRGAESAGVLSFLVALQAQTAIEVRALKGNHEQTMLQFLDDASVGASWASYGGSDTLIAYGVAPPAVTAKTAEWEAARLQLCQALPADHLAFLRNLELMIVVGDYVFVHAGLRPGHDLGAQTEHDVMWIRGDFLQSQKPFGKVVVHGHSPTAQVQILPHRLGIDTGAYATGVLTAVRLCGETRTIFQARVSA